MLANEDERETETENEEEPNFPRTDIQLELSSSDLGHRNDKMGNEDLNRGAGNVLVFDDHNFFQYAPFIIM